MQVVFVRETEETEVVAEEANAPENLEAQEPARDPELPENFNSWSDVEKSRREVQSAFTRTSQENADLKAKLEQLESAQQQQYDPADLEQQLVDQTGIDAETLRTMAWVADQAAANRVRQYQEYQQKEAQRNSEAQYETIANQADQLVAQQHDDWDNYKDKVAEAIMADPDLLPEQAIGTPSKTAIALDRVYKMVKADDVLKQVQEKGEYVDQGRQAKLNAQTLAGAAGRPGTPSDDDEWWSRVQAAANQSYSAKRGAL